MGNWKNISPKVWNPVVAGLLLTVGHWIATGEFNRTELAELVTTAGYGLIGYLSSPGDVPIEIGEASDDLLDAKVSEGERSPL